MTVLRTRVCLLGASNLSLGFPFVVERCLQLFGPDADIRAAHGFGRSYGRWSNVAGPLRELPGLIDSDLWEALDEAPPAENTFALVTDVGNDVAFDRHPDQIEPWVRTVLERLEGHGARILLTGLPVASLETLSPFWFAVFKRLYFPGRKSTRRELIERARELDARLERLCAERGHARFVPPREWYGVDPIHIRLGLRRSAWETILRTWGVEPRDASFRLESRAWRRMKRNHPTRRRFLGREQRFPQPRLELAEGGRVALY